MDRATGVQALLLGTYTVAWVALAIAPLDRVTWFFENLLVFLFVPAVLLTRSWLTFSTRSYVAMFLFLLLHAVGAYYGYTRIPIPWDEWGFERNHSDRVVHFCFGLLAVIPVEEGLRRVARIPGAWGLALAVTATFALAAAFEIVEWLAVEVGGDATGKPEGGYLGTQGDTFDAVKDMGLGLLGSLVTAFLLLRQRPTPVPPRRGGPVEPPKP